MRATDKKITTPLPQTLNISVPPQTVPVAADTKAAVIAKGDEYGQTEAKSGPTTQFVPRDQANHVSVEASNMWGGGLSNASATVKAMICSMDHLAHLAESGHGGLQKAADAHTHTYDGFSPSVRDALSYLWTEEGAPQRAQLEASATRLAKAAPDLVLHGSVSSEEKSTFAQMDQAQLLIAALLRNDLPQNQWQPVATEADLNAMSADALRTFLEKNIEGSRTRAAGSMPLEMAFAEAQFTGDAGAKQEAARALVAMGASKLGPILDFYKSAAKG